MMMTTSLELFSSLQILNINTYLIYTHPLYSIIFNFSRKARTYMESNSSRQIIINTYPVGTRWKQESSSNPCNTPRQTHMQKESREVTKRFRTCQNTTCLFFSLNTNLYHSPFSPYSLDLFS